MSVATHDERSSSVAFGRCGNAIFGATLLRGPWALTAAHCVAPLAKAEEPAPGAPSTWHRHRVESLHRLTGDIDLGATLTLGALRSPAGDPAPHGDLPLSVPVIEIFVPAGGEDIALLRLQRAPGRAFARAELAGAEHAVPHMCVAHGWGDDDAREDVTRLSCTMKRIALDAGPEVQRAAERAYAEHWDGRTMLGAWGAELAIETERGQLQRRGTMQGDSGNGVFARDNKMRVWAVVSGGRETGEMHVPGIYTRVAPFRADMESIIAARA